MKPIKIREFRCELIRARVQQRKVRGRIRTSVTIVRLQLVGDHWQQSTRFTRRDIPKVRLVLDQAFTWMLTERQESKRQS